MRTPIRESTPVELGSESRGCRIRHGSLWKLQFSEFGVAQMEFKQRRMLAQGLPTNKRT